MRLISANQSNTFRSTTLYRYIVGRAAESKVRHVEKHVLRASAKFRKQKRRKSEQSLRSVYMFAARISLSLSRARLNFLSAEICIACKSNPPPIIRGRKPHRERKRRETYTYALTKRHAHAHAHAPCVTHRWQNQPTIESTSVRVSCSFRNDFARSRPRVFTAARLERFVQTFKLAVQACRSSLPRASPRDSA